MEPTSVLAALPTTQAVTLRELVTRPGRRVSVEPVEVAALQRALGDLATIEIDDRDARIVYAHPRLLRWERGAVSVAFAAGAVTVEGRAFDVRDRPLCLAGALVRAAGVARTRELAAEAGVPVRGAGEALAHLVARVGRGSRAFSRDGRGAWLITVPQPCEPEIVIGPIVVDPATLGVWRHRLQLPVPRDDVAVLVALWEQVGTEVSPAALIERAWHGSGTSLQVERAIKRLRKLPLRIEHVRGDYRLAPPTAATRGRHR